MPPSLFPTSLQSSLAGPTPRVAWLLLALPLVAACSDKTVTVLKQPPAVTITNPSSGSTFFEGEAIDFEALVETYGDSDPTGITSRWVSGSEVLCEEETTDASGYTYCSAAFEGAGLRTVEVTVVNDRGDRAKASTDITISANTAPTIDIVSPVADSYYAAEELIIFSATVSDAEEDPQDLVVTVTSSIDGDLGLGAAPTSSGAYETGGYLTVGTHLLTFRVEDATGETDQATTTVIIYEHGPPSVELVGIDPSPAYTDDELVADPQGWEDLDDAPEKYRFRWFKFDGSTMAEDFAEATETYPSGKTVKHDLIQVEVTPYNDYGDGDPVRSSTIEIENTPPDAPTVELQPSAPEPTDNLYCAVTNPAYDADGDPITYIYTWYKNGALTTETSSVVTSDKLGDGDTWQCVVTPNDGEDDGTSASATTSVYDVSAPDAPIINTPTSYRNETSWTLSGTCEAGCDLTVYCADDSTSWVGADVCDGDNTFSYSDTLTRGNTTSCYAECTDSAGNTSPVSNTVTTEVCDPYDIYEDSSGTGDSGAAAINAWSTLNDSGTSTITIEGNILDGDSEDWYVVSTSDDVASDRSLGINYYNFAVTMYDGGTAYAVYVYKDGYDSVDVECPATTGGYSEYNDYVQDKGESVHAAPSDTRSCGYGSSTRNECEDMSSTYYIRVVRLSSAVTSCQAYDLEITNGVW